MRRDARPVFEATWAPLARRRRARGRARRRLAAGVFSELGLVRRDDYDELELRVAQLEHRLRLLERPADD